jgi:hypothetical protein
VTVNHGPSVGFGTARPTVDVILPRPDPILIFAGCPIKEAKGRYSRHIGAASRLRRRDAYAADSRALKLIDDHDRSPRLGLVDLEADEIKQP